MRIIQTFPIIYALGNRGLDWRPGSPEPSSASGTSAAHRDRRTGLARSSVSTQPTPRAREPP